jgi:ATP-dependent helicase/DNAse subunit B
MREDTKEINPNWLKTTGGYAKDMTLRDHYAGLAMQSMLRYYDIATTFDEDEINEPEGMPYWIAKDAYIMADIMLKERSK